MIAEPMQAPVGDPVAVPPTTPSDATPPDVPVGGWPKAENNVASGCDPKKRRNKSGGPSDEFRLMGVVRDAFRDLPSNTARRRVWEWVSGWLAEEYEDRPNTEGPYGGLTRGEINVLLGGGPVAADETR